MFIHPSWGYRHPHMPPLLLCICMFSEASACCGGCRGPLHVGHLPYMLDTSPCMQVPPICLTPPLIGWLSLCICMFLGISACDTGNIPLMLGVWGVPPKDGGLGGDQHHWVSICFILYLLVVHYASHIYHSYDYYSSGYSGVFWALICFISDCGSFPDGVSYNIGSV